MNFDFSEDQKELGRTLRRFLAERCTPATVHAALEDPAAGTGLWRDLAALGYAGAAIPTAYGGAGGVPSDLCVVAEELGRAVAPVPLASSIGLAAGALLAAGTEEQKTELLPRILTGEITGTVLGPGETIAPDGDLVLIAGEDTLAIARHAARTPGTSLDPSRPLARFEPGALEPCGPLDGDALRDGAAVLVAFEQLGGADACLAMANAYAKDRIAFGRPIGSFQALKHKLADMFVAVTLARANCYRAAWALESAPDELALAAATARVSATRAYETCAAENLQIHGGIGFTWESSCHLHYRRSRWLAVVLGTPRTWEDRMIFALERRMAG